MDSLFAKSFVLRYFTVLKYDSRRSHSIKETKKLKTTLKGHESKSFLHQPPTLVFPFHYERYRFFFGGGGGGEGGGGVVKI